MKIIALSDLHNAIHYLEPLAESISAVDLILLVGDITNSGKTENISEIIKFIRKNNDSVLAIPGNWDGQEVSEYLESEKINLHRRHIFRGLIPSNSVISSRPPAG